MLTSVGASSVSIPVRPQRRSSHPMSARRRGNAFAFTVISIAAAVCLGLAGWFCWGRGSDVEYPDYLTTTVWKGPYDFAVIEQGTVESALNTEIRSHVRSRG